MANVTYLRQYGNAKWMGVLVFVSILLLVPAWMTGCKKSPAAVADKDADSADKATLRLEPFVVNLADTEDNRFLRVGIDLGLEKPVPPKQDDTSSGRIRDAVICVLASWRSDALLAPDGKQKLKDELLRALQDRVPELGVREVYLTEFLVQR